MSASQIPFFTKTGFPADRIRVILHGVDTKFFCPGSKPPRTSVRPLQGLLVGNTERDHAFMASVLSRLPSGVLELAVCTTDEQRELHYGNVPNVRMLPRLPDDGLRDVYQKADLLIMPVFDCSANNVILESMACGTPVMANDVGGISEYLDPDCSVIMDGKHPDEWAREIRGLAESLGRLSEMRPAVRAWAERFDWSVAAAQLSRLYDEIFDNMSAVPPLAPNH